MGWEHRRHADLPPQSGRRRYTAASLRSLNRPHPRPSRPVHCRSGTLTSARTPASRSRRRRPCAACSAPSTAATGSKQLGVHLRAWQLPTGTRPHGWWMPAWLPWPVSPVAGEAPSNAINFAFVGSLAWHQGEAAERPAHPSPHHSSARGAPSTRAPRFYATLQLCGCVNSCLPRLA